MCLVCFDRIIVFDGVKLVCKAITRYFSYVTDVRFKLRIYYIISRNLFNLDLYIFHTASHVSSEEMYPFACHSKRVYQLPLQDIYLMGFW